jgi:hypothetical protein
MRVSVGKELRETHRRNEAGLLAEAIAQGVAEDPRSRRVALPIPHPHPLCQVDLHQVAGDRLDPAALSHQERVQLSCSLLACGALASSARKGRPSLPGAAGGSNSLGERHDLIPYLRTYNLLAMETSLFTFATDLHDEGLDTVLGNLQDRAGVDGLTMAVAYHDARDLFPHNPVHKVRYLEGGAVFLLAG